MVLAHDISKGDRTRDVKITQNITFETMLLAPDTMKGLKESGFRKPSPIQLYGIPIGKCGFDLLLEAKSGTGKTAVFTIIALEKLDLCKGLQVVILTPTREIAAQICDVLKQIGSQYKELRVEVVMGGLPLQDDIEKFKKPVHIVVGSPGRLRHLIQNKCIDTKSVRLLVLDEADKLMETSFQSDIKYIHTSLPKQKQVIMSSATYPSSSRHIINSYVQNASHVCPDSDCVLLGIDQKVTFVKYNSNIIRYTKDKFSELHKILGRLQFKQCLVFCNYQVRVTEVHNLLQKADWPSQKLYGQQEQVDRLDALKTLQQYKCRILVSTDLAARGIDASNIDLVINFEPPHDWQTYLHRIGRAGRFGSYGLAITILSEGKETQKFKEMFKSMELSISMCHLWSDTAFNISSSTPNTPPELSTIQLNNPTTVDLLEKVSCENMWELLSGTNISDNLFETFQLQSEFKNSKISKVEPFSELMVSLEENNLQDSGENIMFKHIEITTATTNGSDVSRNTVTEKNVDIMNLKNSYNGNSRHDTYEKALELKATSFGSSKKINITDDNNETDKCYTSLNLDLPIMFSSSKFKTHDTKIRNSIAKIKTDCSNDKKIKDLKENCTHTQSLKNTQLFANNVDTDIDSCFYVERNSSRAKNNYERTNYYYAKEKKYNNSQKKNSDMLHIGKCTLQRLQQSGDIRSYNMWYKQLKISMKYIEQIVYIDEISKY